MKDLFSIDCSSASQALLEAELFGGEAHNQTGLLQINDGRTVYLKEISALDKSTQALLRNYLNKKTEIWRRGLFGSSNALEPLMESMTSTVPCSTGLTKNRIIYCVASRERMTRALWPVIC